MSWMVTARVGCVMLGMMADGSAGESASRPATAPAAKLAPTTAPAQVVVMDDRAGLHNVYDLGKGLYSGSSPEGEAGMESLRKLGVRTIISVDGGTPDVARAKALGMRYVHFPVGYDGIPAQKRLAIARAVRDLPGPVYLHCHHGKHRGPAAAASAAVLLGIMSPDAGMAFLKQAGTGSMYTGLFACIRECRPVDRATLESASADFPEVAEVAGLVARMVEMDEVFEHLQLIRAAGWRVPKDHPDLAPLNEVERLLTLLQATDGDVDEQHDPQAFRRMLATSIEDAGELKALMRRPQPGFEALDAAVEAVNTSCKDCHAQFRNPPKPAATQPAATR